MTVTAAASEVEPALFRSVMRHHAKGVAIITAGTDTPVGFCATSLSSLSLEPALVSFAVGLRTTSWPTMRTAKHVMVHLLADDQEDIARRFATTGAPKFGPETRWHRGPLGLPEIDDVLAYLLVAPVNHLRVGDHALIVAQAIAGRHTASGRPLIHHGGGFVKLVPP